MKNNKMNLGMIVAIIAMIAVVVIKIAGIYMLHSAISVSLINVGTILGTINYVLVIAFFYGLYAKVDVKKLGTGVITVWGINNLLPMVKSVVSTIQQIIYTFELSSVIYLIYIIVLTLVFAFIVLMSINFIYTKKPTSGKNYTLTYLIPIIIMLIAMLAFNAWLKVNGFADEATVMTLIVNSLTSTFYLTLNILKYMIAVLVIKEHKTGAYLLIIYVLVWYVSFMAKSLTAFMQMNSALLVITVFIFLVPFIYYTYTLIMGMIVATRRILNKN